MGPFTPPWDMVCWTDFFILHSKGDSMNHLTQEEFDRFNEDLKEMIIMKVLKRKTRVALY